jgi:hypothetical protein
MAHVRKDTLTTPPEWWNHLKWNKRVVSKAERRAAVFYIQKELMDSKEEFRTLNSRSNKLGL